MFWRALIFCVTLLGVLYIMGIYPAVAVAVTGVVLTGLFLLFRE